MPTIDEIRARYSKPQRESAVGLPRFRMSYAWCVKCPDEYDGLHKGGWAVIHHITIDSPRTSWAGLRCPNCGYEDEHNLLLDDVETNMRHSDDNRGLLREIRKAILPICKLDVNAK
ncbi:MAG: hypothetical protein KAJ19_12270 [Gammaproteobacteria bacterium]|nr:hypothetical protein [Gammaproteobacteria bacterium]